MALPLSSDNILLQLIGTFPNLQSRNKERLHRRLTAILKEHYLTDSVTSIQERFAGIEEKCRIFNNNELADALLARYEELVRWRTPRKFDILSFLQHLSDNPARKTRLEDLDSIEQRLVPVELTWKDIFPGGALKNPEIWRDIDYAASSSEESVGSIEDAQSYQHSSDNVVSDIGISASSLAQSDEEELDRIIVARKAFLDSESSTHIQITETQLIRETICMLQGVPSIVYDEEIDGISPQSCHTVRDVSTEIIHNCLEHFGKIGTVLYSIRQYAEERIKDPLLQSFQACLLSLLHTFDLRLSILEEEVVRSQGKIQTLMNLSNYIEPEVQPLKLLEPLVSSISSEESTFRLLDSLFDLVVQRQGIGDFASYKSIGTVFFQCLHTYLRPVILWLEEGILDDRDKQFFVKCKNKHSSTTSFWNDQFQLDLDDRNQVQAPRFLWPAVQNIFATGKGVNLLRALNHNISNTTDTKAIFTFAAVCGNSSYEVDLFEDLLDNALNEWVHSKCSVSDIQVLREVAQHGQLEKTTNAIEYLFLSKNGFMSQQFADTLFEHMKSNDMLWTDNFWLTELCRDCFRHAPELVSTRMTVRFERSPSFKPKSRFVKNLHMIKIEYGYPWSTSIIIQPHHIDIFQNVFVLLLQLRYASHLLNRHGKLKLPPDGPNQQFIISIRHRSRWFIDLLLSHLTLNVIDSAMRKVYDTFGRAQSLDELIMLNNETIVQMEESCLVAKSQQVALDGIVALLSLVVRFSDLCVAFHGKGSVLSTRRHGIGEDQSDEEDYGPNTKRPLAHDDNALKECSLQFNKTIRLIAFSIQDIIQRSANTSLQILLDSIETGLTKH